MAYVKVNRFTYAYFILKPRPFLPRIFVKLNSLPDNSKGSLAHNISNQVFGDNLHRISVLHQGCSFVNVPEKLQFTTNASVHQKNKQLSRYSKFIKGAKIKVCTKKHRA